ncbi:RrF2 family transcriptional regulator [Microbacterium amylolyticum]|uniref:Rrf2 family protein n=1 Tax=Microbacterium amylolyticum TaxID=936337 RepID=A0ABS4ZJN9_9MICO|nr:Rrf2 family transcriptional regulator [Microbacterium amylolyticum]MBP2437495.1 Rrf2 family protein [Microbacterium amylolyticum]
MRVSTRSDYALRALIELASLTGQGAVSADEIASRQDIPKAFLLAILADLRRAGVVRSQRGQAGGWLLQSPAADVSVADVIRAVDGPLVSVYDQRPEAVSYNDAAAPLQQVWIAARHALRDVLENVTIAELQTKHLPLAVTERAADEDAWQSH